MTALLKCAPYWLWVIASEYLQPGAGAGNGVVLAGPEAEWRVGFFCRLPLEN